MHHRCNAHSKEKCYFGEKKEGKKAREREGKVKPIDKSVKVFSFFERKTKHFLEKKKGSERSGHLLRGNEGAAGLQNQLSRVRILTNRGQWRVTCTN